MRVYLSEDLHSLFSKFKGDSIRDTKGTTLGRKKGLIQ